MRPPRALPSPFVYHANVNGIGPRLDELQAATRSATVISRAACGPSEKVTSPPGAMAPVSSEADTVIVELLSEVLMTRIKPVS